MVNKVEFLNHQMNVNNSGDLDHQDIGWNEFSRELQPKENILCDAEFRIRHFTPKNANIDYNYGWRDGYMEFNGHRFINLQSAGRSSIAVHTDLHIDESKKYYLNLDHCSTLLFGQPLAEVNILVNGQTVASRFNPKNGGNFRQQHFDITDFVRDGQNTVEIQLDRGSEARYWLSTLCIYQK